DRPVSRPDSRIDFIDRTYGHVRRGVRIGDQKVASVGIKGGTANAGDGNGPEGRAGKTKNRPMVAGDIRASGADARPGNTTRNGSPTNEGERRIGACETISIIDGDGIVNRKRVIV